MLTIVTAYYEIKSKFCPGTYCEWINNMMKLNCNLVVFTTSDISEKIRQMRPADYPLKIVEKPFDMLECWVKYENKWKLHHSLDPEKHIHSPELYCIWAQKIFFVEEAIKLNYFNTDLYMWCDIGAFRNANHLDTLKNFSSFTQFVPKNKMVFSSVEQLQKDDYKDNNGFIGNFINKNRIVGGLWLGDVCACLKWKERYELTLNKYFDANVFAGKDQSVMLTTLLENKDLGIVIKPGVGYKHDVWFFLEYLLAGVSTYMIDSTYSIETKKILLTDLPVIFVCPDSNEKYSNRKVHMVNLLNKLGFANVTHYKSSTNSYPKCLSDALVEILRGKLNDEPFLLLEDDVEFNQSVGGMEIEIPTMSDAVYLGISKSGGSLTQNIHDGRSKFEYISSDLVRVTNMLSGHAILFITRKYKECVVELLLKQGDTVYNTDVLMSRIHPYFNVFGLRNPYFYQSAGFGNVQHVQNETFFTITDDLIQK